VRIIVMMIARFIGREMNDVDFVFFFFPLNKLLSKD